MTGYRESDLLVICNATPTRTSSSHFPVCECTHFSDKHKPTYGDKCEPSPVDFQPLRISQDHRLSHRRAPFAPSGSVEDRKDEDEVARV